MRIPFKFGLTALATSLLLFAAIGTASARNLSVSSQNFRATWFILNIEASTGGFIAVCQVTLEGSFHSRTIAKVARSLIGAITKATVKTESCVGEPRIRVRSPRLPWHVTYESFTGTLPSITALRILLSRFRFEYFETQATCNYGSSTDNMTFEASVTSGSISALTPLAGRATASLVEGNIFFCPSRVVLSEAGTVTVLNGTAMITIRLI